MGHAHVQCHINLVDSAKPRRRKRDCTIAEGGIGGARFRVEAGGGGDAGEVEKDVLPLQSATGRTPPVTVRGSSALARSLGRRWWRLRSRLRATQEAVFVCTASSLGDQNLSVLP